MATSKKEDATESTAIVPVADMSFAVALMAQEGGSIQVALEENIGPEGITPFDLDRVKIPAGGGQAWEVPSLAGDEIAKSVEGIVVAWQSPRAYWSASLDESGGGTPPDCSSVDGITGVGTPGGSCAKCPLSQWGSKEGSRGQACKQMRLLFLLRESDLLPLAFFLPPTSISPMKRYSLRLAGQGLPLSAVVTKLGLEKKSNPSGIAYSAVVPEYVRTLEGEERELVKGYADGFKSMLSVPLTQEAFADANGYGSGADDGY